MFRALIKTLCDTAFPLLATRGAAGFDLAASEHCVIKAGGVGAVPTGLVLRFPEGHFGRIIGRSGMSLRNIDVAGGLVDEDYCGEDRCGCQFSVVTELYNQLFNI